MATRFRIGDIVNTTCGQGKIIEVVSRNHKSTIYTVFCEHAKLSSSFYSKDLTLVKRAKKNVCCICGTSNNVYPWYDAQLRNMMTTPPSDFEYFVCKDPQNKFGGRCWETINIVSKKSIHWPFKSKNDVVSFVKEVKHFIKTGLFMTDKTSLSIDAFTSSEIEIIKMYINFADSVERFCNSMRGDADFASLKSKLSAKETYRRSKI